MRDVGRSVTVAGLRAVVGLAAEVAIADVALRALIADGFVVDHAAEGVCRALAVVVIVTLLQRGLAQRLALALAIPGETRAAVAGEAAEGVHAARVIDAVVFAAGALVHVFAACAVAGHPVIAGAAEAVVLIGTL